MDITTLVTAMTGAFTEVSENVLTLVAGLLPIGLGIIGVKLAIHYGISFVKSMTSK